MIFSVINLRSLLFLLLISLAGFGCVSRYRLNLNILLENNSLSAKVTEAEYFGQVKFGDIYSDNKLITGNDNCIVLNTSSRGKAVDVDGATMPLFRMDEDIRCKLFLLLPTQPEATTLNLDNISFVQILGRYEIPVEDKIYEATAGTLLIDSIVDAEILYGTIDGSYQNSLEQAVLYQGQFRVKIAN